MIPLHSVSTSSHVSVNDMGRVGRLLTLEEHHRNAHHQPVDVFPGEEAFPAVNLSGEGALIYRTLCPVDDLGFDKHLHELDLSDVFVLDNEDVMENPRDAP